MSLPTHYQNFIHQSRYARWIEQDNRRETWEETVWRYFDFFMPFLDTKHDAGLNMEEVSPLIQTVLRLGVMPSMRCMMTAGPALERDHVAGYNCAFRAIDTPRAFDEILYVLMCGTGVGFSVERQFINKLPEIPSITDTDTVIHVEDSKYGWANALRELIAMLYSGRKPKWDVSKLRPKGARLKTMGGRSSGPDPLVELFQFTCDTFLESSGRKLTSIECHDLACKVGDCVVVGGVRRSAMLSLSNLSDGRMRDAKTGEWHILNPQRMMSNNSVAYTERPEVGQFMSEWTSLYESKSGERGIFNREAARLQAIKSGRRMGWWDKDNQDPIDFGTNPCSEIILRSEQFCNLTEVIAREEDTFETLMEKVKVATILGTWQSCLTDFVYLGDMWRLNCKEERLLGVSLTGIFDNLLLQEKEPFGSPGTLKEVLTLLKQQAIDTNKEWSERLNINQSTAITCVKPSGTVSQLANAASGIHPRYARQYIRRVRQDMKDPVTNFLIDMGLPHEPDVMKPDDMMVFEFPIRAPEMSTTGDEITAIEHLEFWKTYQDHWCEHKPSITVSVKDEEWPGVGGWVWDHFDQMSGVSFLPAEGKHSYRQAPYEVVDEEVFSNLEAKMPEDINWNDLVKYETENSISRTQDLACAAGQCDIA